MKEDPWDVKNSSSKCMDENFLIKVSRKKKPVRRNKRSRIGHERIP